jgi:hypothetical protein
MRYFLQRLFYYDKKAFNLDRDNSPGSIRLAHLWGCAENAC